MKEILRFFYALAWIPFIESYAGDAADIQELTASAINKTTAQNSAQDLTIGSLTLKNYWVRKPSGGPNTAAYVTIENTGDVSDQLMSASCDASVAQSVELHDHIMENGVAKMRPVESIDIPSKGEATLAPGGKHIMLMKLEGGLHGEKDSLDITLSFKNAGIVAVSFPIKESIKKH